MFAILNCDPKRTFLYSTYIGKTADYVIVNIQLHLKCSDAVIEDRSVLKLKLSYMCAVGQ